MSNYRSTAIDCIKKFAFGGLLLTLPTEAFAGKPDNMTEAEFALLPKYCADAQGMGKYGDASYNTSPYAAKWVGLMGPGFWAIHHYCWALTNLARVQKPSVPALERQATRENAINDIYYVVKNTGPDFILLPEIYTKIGEVQLLLRHPSEAGSAFEKARSLKPDYWPAYFQWAEFLRNAGKKTEARQIVEEGLSFSPNSKTLQNLLTSLGGDPTTIKPRQAPSPASVPAE